MTEAEKLLQHKLDCDIDLLTYILKVIEDSRTKKQVSNRLHGLLQLRREQRGDCIVFTKEMIKDYQEKQNKTKEQIPQTPFTEVHQSNGERTKKIKRN